MRRQRTVSESPFQHNRRKDQNSRTQAVYCRVFVEQAGQKCAESALQNKTQHYKYSEILESPGKNAFENFEKYGKQRYGVRKSDGISVRIGDIFSHTQRKLPRTVPIQQPSGIMLGYILFYVSFANKAVRKWVYYTYAVYRDKYGQTYQPAADEKYCFSFLFCIDIKAPAIAFIKFTALQFYIYLVDTENF